MFSLLSRLGGIMFKKLDLVNACLRAIGNEQVGDLDFPDVDTDIAIVTVEEAVVDVLSHGWWFNTESHWKLTPSASNGEIEIGDSIIDLRTYRVSRQAKLVKRSGKLYDMTNHTFDLRPLVENDGTIDFDFLMNLVVEDCPVVAQQYMREKSLHKYLLDLEADNLKIQNSAERMHRFLALLEKQHYRNSKFNVYQHSGVQAVLSGMASVNSFAGFEGNALGGGSDR